MIVVGMNMDFLMWGTIEIVDYLFCGITVKYQWWNPDVRASLGISSPR